MYVCTPKKTFKPAYLPKVCSFLEHSCAILSSFKIVIIFNITSAEIKTKSADVLLKIISILKNLRIAQLCSKNERTLLALMTDWLENRRPGPWSLDTDLEVVPQN